MRPVLAAVSLVIALAPATALACPVCFVATEANRNAFLLTTVFLSLLPLAMIGALLRFLARSAATQEATDLDHSDSAD